MMAKHGLERDAQMAFRFDKMGIAYDYSGLSALFDGSDWPKRGIQYSVIQFFSR